MLAGDWKIDNQIEWRMKKMNAASFKLSLQQNVELYEQILIVGHVNPDPDCYGSVFGLKNILKALHPEKDIRVDLEKNDFLLDLCDELLDEPFAQEQKVLLIGVDTASIERLATDFVPFADKIIKIDHHPDETPYGDVSFVDTSFASASEIVICLFQAEIDAFVTPTIAKQLYFGIVGDTGRFLYPSTNSGTLALAAKVIDYFDAKKEIHDVLATKSENVVRLEGLLKSGFEQLGDVAYFTIHQEQLAQFNVSFTDASNLVNAMAGIKGINVWALAIEQADGYRVRIRSNERGIHEVAKIYQGGGHPLASGAFVENKQQFIELIHALHVTC